MSENPIIISTLNDFVFCPVSIYFHSLDLETDKISYQEEAQINGTAAHKASDSGTFSDRKEVLQSISVYSEKYNLFGKIDVFNTESGILTERKKKISQIYDGYVFQLYAQYFALADMGYSVQKLRLYSMDDNKSYNIKLPKDDEIMLFKFEKLLFNMQNFMFENFKQTNLEKCLHCIYNPICSFSLTEDEKC